MLSAMPISPDPMLKNLDFRNGRIRAMASDSVTVGHANWFHPAFLLFSSLPVLLAQENGRERCEAEGL